MSGFVQAEELNGCSDRNGRQKLTVMKKPAQITRDEREDGRKVRKTIQRLYYGGFRWNLPVNRN
ncbi:MAG: hypothetical protein ACLFN4_07605 [Candidatus Acetothermia bacterium]